MYIEQINSPADVKAMAAAQLPALCEEIRSLLIEKLSEHGGHVGPNLGMVEATVAIHRVFSSPTDKIVFDVSHQSYTHKMLTGRRDAFMRSEAYDDVSGYSEPSESEHDHFVIGHTSTSISLASGLAKARDLQGLRHNVIAVIGDGSLSGGQAFEGLNVGAELGTNFIVVVNDNQMSIAENHGALYRNLQLLRETNGEASCNYFKALGYDYLYVDEGNNVDALIHAFNRVKNTDHPVVLHINTLKGKGYRFAEEEKERFHWSMPFVKETGKLRTDYSAYENYADLTADFLLSEMKHRPELVALTAGTPAVFGFDPQRRAAAGKQFLDMGIAEEQAVAMSSALAKGGARPVFGVYSTFLQRAYDQLSHDLCINNNPAVILVYGGGVRSMNDVTHLCFFDIPLLSNIPNMTYLCPASVEEYIDMLRWAVRQTSSPVALRVPTGPLLHDATYRPATTDEAMPWRYDVKQQGAEVAILALGSFSTLGAEVAARLQSEHDITPTLINPRCVTQLDTACLDALAERHRLVLTLEDGVVDGGFGEKIARYYGRADVSVVVRGLEKKFVDRYVLDQLMAENRLTVPQLVADCLL